MNELGGLGDVEMVDVEQRRGHYLTNPLGHRAHQLRAHPGVPSESCYLHAPRARAPPPPKETFDHARLAAEASWHEVSLILVFCCIFFIFISPRLSRRSPSLLLHPQHNRQHQFTVKNLMGEGKRVCVDLHLLAQSERIAGSKGRSLTKGLSYARRCAIRYYFEYIFGAPAEDAVDEDGGSIWEAIAYMIEDFLFMPAGSRKIVLQVFKDVLKALEAEKVYDPSKGSKQRGRRAVIQENSSEALIVMNSMRCGLGLAESTSILNSYRIFHDLETVSYGAVQGFVSRSKIMKIHRRGTKKAGSSSASSDWAVARVVQCQQFYQQYLNGLEWDKKYEETPAKLRSAFKLEFDLPPIFLDGLTFWDEHHKKCKLGFASKWETLLRFDEEGYPSEEGKWEPEHPNTSVKKADEVRGCFGVGVRTEGRPLNPVGHRLKIYDYTMQTVVGPKNFERREAEEIERAKKLPSRPFDYAKLYPNPIVRRQKLKEKLWILGYCDVRDIMDHIVGEHNKLYKGTKREKTSMIFHDHLKAWFEDEAQVHLKKLGFENRQLRILPANYDKVVLGYRGKLAGNSPEMCRGLDAHGFADLDRSTVLNCSIAATLALEDPVRKRWGMGTPITLRYSMWNSWSHSPSSERIIEDIMNFPMVLKKIIDAEGCVVPDEILRTGRRAIPGGTKPSGGSKKRSRSRKATIRPAEHHPELHEAWKAMMDPAAIQAKLRNPHIQDA
jgi:hypothetical protein